MRTQQKSEQAAGLELCLHKAYDRTGQVPPAVDLIRLILKLSRYRRTADVGQRRPLTPIDGPMTTMPAPPRGAVRMAGW